MGTRLTIDGLTCLLATETDSSKLLAVSPGKLIRYLVEDGSHVSKDQAYAEIEVSPLCPYSVLPQRRSQGPFILQCHAACQSGRSN